MSTAQVPSEEAGTEGSAKLADRIEYLEQRVSDHEASLIRLFLQVSALEGLVRQYMEAPSEPAAVPTD